MKLSCGARRLFKLIEDFIRKSHRAFRASQRWVAAHFGVSLRVVKRWYAELKPLRVFNIRRRPNRSSEIIILRFILAPPVAPPVALPSIEPSVVNPSGSERQHHRDDAAESSLEQVVRKAAGFERLSEGDRRWCRDLERSGVSLEVARAGVLIGRARHMTGKTVREPIHSARYFAGPIAEAVRGAFQPEYIDRLPGWIERAMAATA